MDGELAREQIIHLQEMDKFQKGLVDTSFEEGQYEAGIAMLDQLCSGQTMPAPIHIRELVFLALYPPLASVVNERALAQENLIASPSKLASPTKPRPKRQPLIPTAAASDAATRLLFLLAYSTPASSILRALPNCDSPPLDGREHIQGAEDESYVARESQCLSQCRSSWELLRNGVVKPKADAFKDVKGVKRRRVDEYDINEELGLDTNAVVGKSAWPILELLIILYEKDCVADDQDAMPYSSSLLMQIPPPRSGVGLRWDVGVALSVVFDCFNQNEAKRQRLGIRLLTQLINLLGSRQIDHSSFVDSIAKKLQVNDWRDFSRVLRACGPAPITLYFKMLLCKWVLQAGNSAPARIRAIPKARPQPRARTWAARNAIQDDLSELAPAPPDAPTAIGEPQLPGTPGAHIRLEEVTVLLGQKAPASRQKAGPELHTRAKLELIAAYVQFRRMANMRAHGELDSTWLETPPFFDALQAFQDSVDRAKDCTPDAETVRSTVAMIIEAGRSRRGLPRGGPSATA